MEQGFNISPSQGHQLLALWEMLRAGDLSIHGDDGKAIEGAASILQDVAQEIALQVGGDG